MTNKRVWSCVAAFLLGACGAGAATNESLRSTPTASPASEGGFDPKEFLCDLAGDSPGRRFTSDERAVARARIQQEFARMGLVLGPHDYVNAKHGRGTNLYHVLPATVPTDKSIVVGAHYDTVKAGPGADDDGSGVTALIMIAERLKRLPNRSANVIFAFFDQEELGLIGSRHFAAWLTATGTTWIDLVEAHCIDMIGYDGDRDRVVELGHSAKPVAGTGAHFVRLYERAAARLGRPPGSVRGTDMGRSDHESFIKHGVRAVIVSQEIVDGDFSPHYHEPSDTCDTVDYGYLRATADLVAEAVSLRLQ